MIRDMDLIRRIVLAVREADRPVSEQHLSDIEPARFAAHVQLLVEAGLVTAALSPDDKRPATKATIWRLTWAGQNFADSVLEDTLWNKAKAQVIKPSASWSFGVLLRWIEVEISSRFPNL